MVHLTLAIGDFLLILLGAGLSIALGIVGLGVAGIGAVGGAAIMFRRWRRERRGR